MKEKIRAENELEEEEEYEDHPSIRGSNAGPRRKTQAKSIFGRYKSKPAPPPSYPNPIMSQFTAHMPNPGFGNPPSGFPPGFPPGGNPGMGPGGLSQYPPQGSMGNMYAGPPPPPRGMVQ